MEEKIPLWKERSYTMHKKNPDISSVVENPSDLDTRFDNLMFCFVRRKFTDKIISKIRAPKD